MTAAMEEADLGALEETQLLTYFKSVASHLVNTRSDHIDLGADEHCPVASPDRAGPAGHTRAERLGRPTSLHFWRVKRRRELVADVRGAGRAVVLLHGQPGSARDWRLVATDLARDHRVIVPDRLGYGLTGGRAAGFAANANAVIRLLGSLDETSALVVGHSWAGGIAIELALDYPGSVGGLALVCSVAPGDPPGRLDRLLALPLLGTALAATTLSTAGGVLSWGPTRAFADWRLRGRSEEHLAALTRDWRRRATWTSFAVEQRALVHELPAMAPRLARIVTPTIVLAGSLDRVVTAAAARRLAGAIPGAVLEVVAGGGHLLPQLQPGTVASAIRRLASRCP
jgi:pimeloyl-ACP methyl ester carboxylesterase